MIDRILRKPAVEEILGISTSTLYRVLKNDPTFPRPILISERASGFRESELQAWIESKKSQEVKQPKQLVGKGGRGRTAK